jgi:processive 1,2-diacylglycerol beta-glucosyltransferase
MQKRILIASASVGAGHMRAAEAVHAAMLSAEPEARIENRDILELTTGAFRKLYRDTYLEMVGKAPEVFGWLYQATDQPFQKRRVLRGVEEASAQKFLHFVRDFDPDLALCTHFLPASLLHHERRKKRARCTIATVITDFDAHGLWFAPPSDHYFVAGEDTRRHLIALGIPAESVTVSGIPTHPAFSQPRNRAESRAKLGLRADLKTVLLSTGGFGTGNAAQLLEALLAVDRPLQVIAVCGRNAQLKARLERLAAGKPDIHVLGFTTEMHEWMAASDVVMGKPGGLTTWESFHSGLVWAVVNPIPGQEERNTIHLLEEGAGIWCNNLHTIAYKLGRLLEDEERLRLMSANSRRLARPDAAPLIARTAMGLITGDGR